MDMESLTPEEIREVNQRLAREFIEYRLAVPATPEAINLLTGCIEKIESEVDQFNLNNHLYKPQ